VDGVITTATLTVGNAAELRSEFQDAGADIFENAAADVTGGLSSAAAGTGGDQLRGGTSDSGLGSAALPRLQMAQKGQRAASRSDGGQVGDVGQSADSTEPANDKQAVVQAAARPATEVRAPLLPAVQCAVRGTVFQPLKQRSALAARRPPPLPRRLRRACGSRAT
jgi:hypothetical protein